MPWKEGKTRRRWQKKKKKETSTLTLTYSLRFSNQSTASLVTENMGSLGRQESDDGVRWKSGRDKRKEEEMRGRREERRHNIIVVGPSVLRLDRTSF